MIQKVNSIGFRASAFQQNSYFLTIPDEQSKKPVTNNKIKTGAKLAVGSAIAGLGILSVVQGKYIQKLMQTIAAQAYEIENGVPKNSQLFEEKILPYTVKKFKETALYPTFKKSKQTFVEYITNTKSPEKIKEFLFGITADEKISSKFITEITANPRDSFKNTKILTTAIGGEKNLTEWLYAPEGYILAYRNHLKKIVDNPKTTLDDLIKISPNWHLFAMIDKTGSKINRENVWDPAKIFFGKIPQEIQELGDYRHFINWINEKTPHDGNVVVNEFSEKYIKSQQLSRGMSAKRPIKLEFCDKDGENITKTFVLKTEPSPIQNHDIFNQENLVYRSDSNFIDAQIDYYLNLNNCENATGFHFYDFKTNSSLYEFVKGEKYTGSTNLIELNRNMPDLNRLGIFYNDTNTSNFVVKDGITKIIDSGESTYNDVLKPLCQPYHFELPNWCGKKLANLTIGKILGE